MRTFQSSEQLTPQQRLEREIPLLGATDEELLALRVISQSEAERYQHEFRQLRTYCTFIGYPRSGHSILGSLIDAHPSAIIAHELDALRFLQAGFTEPQLYYLLLENSRLFTQHGRKWGRYSYAVPDQWQGRYSELNVIGDNKGGRTTVRIGNDWSSLQRLCDTVRLDHRFIHVVRNPFDNIATIAMRQTKDLAKAVDQYFFMCRTNARLRQELGPRVLDLYHEDFIADPRGVLARLCEFLGLSTDLDYLAACSGIVYRIPHRSRIEVQWPSGMIDRISREQQQFEFLSRYAFGD
jgi:hypothetical protein